MSCKGPCTCKGHVCEIDGGTPFASRELSFYVLPLNEKGWHNLPDDVFRAAWESMPRVAIFDGAQAVDADDREELLGSMREIANGFLTRTRDGTDRAISERYFATRPEAEAHLRATLRAAGYRMIKETP